MSAGGWLVVLDRAGRGARQFPLEAGRATLGSDPACDIRLALPAVSAHHATVAVHCNQAIVRSVSERATLVNGAPVSAAPLRHGDVIALGGRRLRWEYRLPALRRATGLPGEQTALVRRVARARAPRRGSEPTPRDPIVPEHRASMPASTSGKQVAIVQPQRRGAAEQNASTTTANTTASPAPAPSQPSSKRPRAPRAAPPAPPAPAYNPTTMATLWIESRKSSPRRSAVKQQQHAPAPAEARPPTSPVPPARARKAVSARKRTPLRMLVLRKAQSAHKPRVTKIRAPLRMDSTKQAAIMLMARHTPKGKSPGGRGPSYAPKGRSAAGRRARGKRSSTSRGASDNSYASVVEIVDSDSSRSRVRASSATRRSPSPSPSLTNPRKSALKRPSGGRKAENIKFDLSNLDTRRDRSSDAAASRTVDSETELTLRYSDSPKSPSPRISIHSRSSRMLESTLGTSIPSSPRLDRTPASPSPRKKAVRGSIILQKALGKSEGDASTYSRRSTREHSWSAGAGPARRPLESYSIVDLVSDSNDSLTSRSGSVYDSAHSLDVTLYDTPGKRAKVVFYTEAMPGFSTPASGAVEPPAYGGGGSARARKDGSGVADGSAAGDADVSVTTPENTEDATRNVTLNSTRISRASKKRSQIVVDEPDEDSSPKSSRRIGKPGRPSPPTRSNVSINDTPPTNKGDHTPENQRSPVDASTPVLNIRSLLDASRHSNASPGRGGLRKSRRKTIGVLHSERGRGGWADLGSKSLSLRRSVRARDISANFEASDDGAVTPTSAAKPVPEGVKNKHSSAKKPLSKRSLIDHLDESDIVKQLFNSPVKRKLSQSMTEFSRRLLDDDFDRPRRPKRATVAGIGGSNDSSLVDHTERYTPDVFVSPLHTPRNSPNLSGVKRLFQRCTPDDDLRNARGVKRPLRTPRYRGSGRSDLSEESGVKRVVARSPRNRLSDGRVKELFAASPKDDLGRVSGDKNLFRSQRKKGRSPKNELEDLRGVRNLFLENSPKNDLRNVSGVKRTLRRTSPRNDLDDVRGVKRMFREERPRSELGDVSGVERLFDESANYDSTFDQLLGRPPIRAVYTKAKSFIAEGRVQKKGRPKANTKSLHDISMITDNVEEWIQNKLMEQLHRKAPMGTSASKGRKSLNKSRNSSKVNLSRELQKLNTETVDGSVPLIVSRTRNSSVLGNVPSDTRSFKKSASEVYGAHTLPIKKRSLAEASVNRSGNDRSHKLPIKKRAVVHSTPFKGTANITMNASEIGRMSPIASEHGAAQAGRTIRAQSQVSPGTKSPVKANSTTGASKRELPVAVARYSPKKASPLKVKKPSPKKTRSGKNKPSSKKGHPAELESSPKNAPTAEVILSPKKTRSRKAAPTSPVAAKTRKGAKTKKENQEMLNVRKRRSSIVIKKKSPVLSPQQAALKVTRAQKTNLAQTEVDPKISPKKTRSTRAQKSRVSVEAKASPKSTRAKVRRTSVAVTKPSPKLKPRATRNTQDKVVDSQPEVQLPTKRTRKITITEPEHKGNNKKAKPSPKEAQVEGPTRRQTRKAAVNDVTVDRTVAEKSLSIVQTRRTRKIARDTHSDNTEEKTNAPSKRTRKGAPTKPAGTEPNTASLKSIQAQSSVESVTRGGRRTKANVAVPELHEEEPNAQNKRTRSTQSKSKPGTSNTARKAIETQASVESVGRGRRNTKQDVTAEAAPSNKRKIEKPAPAPKATEGKTNARGRNTRAVIVEEKQPVVEELPPTRGRKRKNTDRDEPEIKESVVKRQTRGKAKQDVVDLKESVGVGKGGRRGAGDSAGAGGKAPGAAPRSRSAQAAAAAPPPKGRRTASVATARLKTTDVEIPDAKETKRARRGAGGAAQGAGGRARRR